MEKDDLNALERPSVRHLPWIIVYAIALAAVIFVVFGLREDPTAENYGSLHLRFQSDIRYEFEGRTYSYRGNELTNVLFLVGDEGPSDPTREPAFMLLVSADREFRTMTIFYIGQNQLDGSGEARASMDAVSSLLGGIPIRGYISMGMEELSALVRQVEGTGDPDIQQALQSADLKTNLSQNDILEYMTNWRIYERRDVIKASDTDALGTKILETFFE